MGASVVVLTCTLMSNVTFDSFILIHKSEINKILRNKHVRPPAYGIVSCGLVVWYCCFFNFSAVVLSCNFFF